MMNIHSARSARTVAATLSMALIALAQSSAAQQAPMDPEIQRVLASAQAGGLPVESIVERIQLGISVGAPRDQIIVVAREHLARMETARGLLAPRPTALDIRAGAVALGHGVPEASIRLIRAQRPGLPVIVPIGVLTQLVSSGVDAPGATAKVTEWMRKGAEDAQLLVFERTFAASVKGGMDARRALAYGERQLIAVIPGGGVAALSLEAATPPTVPTSMNDTRATTTIRRPPR